MRNSVAVAALAATALLIGCTTTTQVDNSPGRPTAYIPPTEPSPAGGVGIEAQDIVSMTDRMVRDLLATPQVVNLGHPARIVVDSKYFHNDSSSRVNRDLITDRLRVNLARSAGSRLVFLARHQASMVEDERALEQDGVVTGGTQGPTSAALGWDFRLGGRIATLDQVAPRTGVQTRYHQITFELVERGSGVVVWTNQYEFQKLGQDDVVYR